MTLNDWKKEYYPIEADTFAGKDYTDLYIAIEAVKHSLKKWSGLQEKVMCEYSIEKSGDIIFDNTSRLSITDESCACCRLVNYPRLGCEYCPISLATKYSCLGEYSDWIQKDDPIPLIELLEDTLDIIGNITPEQYKAKFNG